MKAILALVALVVLLAGGWYLYKNNQAAPVRPTTETTTQVNTDMETSSSGETVSSAQPAPAQTKVFNLTGKMFAYSPSEIRVKKGDTVTVNFESTDVLHDWVVDQFHARTQQVEPGTKTAVTFVADKTGTFEYYCSVGQHRARGMVGKLIVE